MRISHIDDKFSNFITTRKIVMTNNLDQSIASILRTNTVQPTSQDNASIDQDNHNPEIIADISLKRALRNNYDLIEGCSTVNGVTTYTARHLSSCCEVNQVMIDIIPFDKFIVFPSLDQPNGSIYIDAFTKEEVIKITNGIAHSVLARNKIFDGYVYTFSPFDEENLLEAHDELQELYKRWDPNFYVPYSNLSCLSKK